MPIAELLGLDNPDPDSSEAQFIEDERTRQELISICMKNQGFSYIATDPSEAITHGGPEAAKWGSDEWVARYGFGVSTMAFSQEAVGPNLVGYESIPTGMNDFTDPNKKTVEAMSEAERLAYHEALHGDRFDAGAEDDAPTVGFQSEPDGCEGEAYRRSGRAEKDAFHREFNDELNEMYQRMEADHRVVRQQREVSECMASNGFHFTTMEDIYQEFDERLLLLGQETTPGERLTEEDLASLGEQDLVDSVDQEPVLSEQNRALLAEIQESEQAMAKAVNGCGGGLAAMEVLFQELVVEYKQEFAKDYADELAQFSSR